MSPDASSENNAAEPADSRPGEPIELRVHGVSGTPPEALLDRPLVTQVAGDAIAGFYRARLEDEVTDDRPVPTATPRPGAPEMEGYNWGGLTSGSPGRALWLFLLPFTLVNIAPRARPNPADDGAGQQLLTRLTWVFSRWLALALTLLLVVTAAGIGMNLMGWQCSQTSVCHGAGTTGPLNKVFGSFEQLYPQGPWVKEGGWSPHAMVLLGALVPLGMLLALWFVSKRTLDRYESVPIGIPKGPEGPTGSGDRLGTITETITENDTEHNLDSPWMWRNAAQVRRLRATHVQAGIAATWWIAVGAADTSPLVVLVYLVAGLVLLYSFVALALPSYVGHADSTRWGAVSTVIWPALTGAGVLAALEITAGDLTDEKRKIGASLPHFDDNLEFLVYLTFGLTLAVIVVIALQALKTPRQAPGTAQADLKPGLLGMTGALLATMAVLTGAVFSASAYTVAAAWLQWGSLKPGPSQVAQSLDAFAVPDTFRMAAFVFFFAVLFAGVVVVAAVAALAWALGGGAGEKRRPTRLVVPGSVAVDYGGEAATDWTLQVDPSTPEGKEAARDVRDHNSRRRSIERAMFFGALVEPGLWVLGFLVAVGILVTFVGAGVLQADSWSLVKHIKGEATMVGDPRWEVQVEGWGAYLAVLTLVLLVALTSLAFRAQTTRRGVGIIWDVASFWPRACHPLAAPCYAERTVPDLTTRLHYFRNDPRGDRPVILSAHSQGTVLSMAALFSLKAHQGGDRDISGISLLTYGCVLRRLYGRFFPFYFGTPRLHALQQLLTAGADTAKATPRWINLWRYTDYLGGQVTDGPRQQVALKNQGANFRNGLLTAPPSIGPQPWEWHAPDPPHFDRQAGETTYSAPSRHSNFYKDDSGYFQLAIERLVRGNDPAT